MPLPLPSIPVRALLIGLGGFGLILGIGVVFWRWLNPVVHLRVVNETETPLVDVHLAYPGGTRWVDRILPGEEALWGIRPSGQAPVVLSYRDSGGMLISRRAEVDLQGAHRRDVELQVQPGRVRLVDHLDVEPT